jgi:uncharacterized protein
MLIPEEKECFNLLEKYETPSHIVAHSRKVWEVGKFLGLALLRRNYPVNLDLLGAACLLHDIGKYPCIVDGAGYHDVRGEQILESEGYPLVAKLVVQHVVLRCPKDAPVAEEHVLFYSDKRVVHDEVVSIEDRFVYLERTYGKTNEALAMLSVMKQETQRLENEIFQLVDFQPEDLLVLRA